MTSIWNKNISLFKERFPALYEMLCAQIESVAANGVPPSPESLNAQFPFYKFSFAKNGELTAASNGMALHSTYNPSREAAQAADQSKNSEKEIFIFAGLGLGYLALECAKRFSDKTFIVLEQDAPHFFAALASLDFTELFKIQKLFFIIGASVEQAAALVESAGGFENAKIFCQKAQIAHASQYFDSFFARGEQAKQKAQVNTNTLERFGMLWLKNSARNLEAMQRLDGVNIYFNAAASNNNGEQMPNGIEFQPLAAVILAAGPTLEEALPHLNAIKDRAVLIALDTSLRAMLRAGVEPDFIVLTDPQYWAWQHIAQLKSPSSVLIAEGAVYPSVFRFECSKIVLTSSLFPLGKFIESRLGKKGELSSGGSVSTTAWEFARAIGSKEIYFSGLDLGFPQKKTHIKGSTFEEAAHRNSTRISTAESALCGILFSAKNQIGADYNGSPIITDERMKLFASWFEQKIAFLAQSEQNCKTFTLSKSGLAIKGVQHCPLQKFLERPAIAEQKKEFFARAAQKSSAYNKDEFNAVIAELQSQFEKLKSLSERGQAICNDILCGHPRGAELIRQLEGIDAQILSSNAKTVAALVFPTQRQLDAILANTKIPADALKANAVKSRVIYSELEKAINTYLRYIK